MKLLTLAAIVAALTTDAQFQGAATDEPEGSRYLNISATLAGQFAESIGAAITDIEHLQAELDEQKALNVQTKLEKEVDVALAHAGLELGSIDAEHAFRAELLAAAGEAEDSGAAIEALIDAKEKALGLPNDNMPGLKASETDKLSGKVKEIDTRASSLN